MKSFSMGIDYLRQEALKSGFIAESDNDNKLIERLSQVVRRLGPEDAERTDELSEAAKKKVSDEPSSDKRPERKA